MRIRTLSAGALALLIQACSSAETGPSTTSQTTSSSSQGGSGGGTSTDTCPGADVEPPAPPDDLCARLRGGAAGTRPVPVDLSAAHAAIRFFAPIGALGDADQALIDALEDPAALTEPKLAAFATALPGVACALPAESGALPAAKVEMIGDVAVIHPGAGDIALPAEASAVAIDLRGLAEVPGLREALEAAVAPAILAPVIGTNVMVRRHEGLEDEMFSASNVYRATTHDRALPLIAPAGQKALPLAVLTEAVMAPAAAALAGRLRLGGHAWVFGESVRADVAEAKWQGVGDVGVGYRAGDLYQKVLTDPGDRWPDEIPADRRSLHPECLLGGLSGLGAPPALTMTPPARAVVQDLHGFGDEQPGTLTLGTARAALIAAHGTVRLFYPYFAAVGDHIDDRLMETLDALGDTAPADRVIVNRALRRFGHALDDGHIVVLDNVAVATPLPAGSGSFPVYIEEINGDAVVRRSLAVGVSPGDTITSIAGVPAATWYAAELARTPAASEGYRFHRASGRILGLLGPTQFGLRHADGTEETITAQPQPSSDLDALGFVASLRPAGFLDDLGAPELYYINLDAQVMSSTGALVTALDEALPAKGLVIDMRGYPGMLHSTIVRRLVQKSFKSPTYLVRTLDGPDAAFTNEDSYSYSPLTNPSYAGPIVLLVGHATVSAAEDFSTMLVDANRVKVMGRRSAATNGNITGVQLPGSYAFSFTGMDVRHADAAMSVFHGFGIVPDQETVLTAAAFAAGLDPELMDAIAWLAAQGP